MDNFSVKIWSIKENVSAVLELTLDYRQTTDIISTEDVLFHFVKNAYKSRLQLLEVTL
jgi:hypothetical protein